MYNIGQRLRHVGRHATNHSRVVVVYKQLQDDPFHAVVVYTDSLPTVDREELLILLSSGDGQKEEDFNVALYKNKNLLGHFHQKGFLKRVHIDEIELMPEANNPIPLRTVVDLINKAKGMPTLAELEQVNTEHTTESTLTGLNPPVESNLTKESIDNKARTTRLSADEKRSIAKGLIIQAKLLEEDMNRKLKEAYKLDASLKPKSKVSK